MVFLKEPAATAAAGLEFRNPSKREKVPNVDFETLVIKKKISTEAAAAAAPAAAKTAAVFSLS